MSTGMILFSLIDGYKTYAFVILTIISGLGLVLSNNYSDGLTRIFGVFMILFGGGSLASLRHAIAKIESTIKGDTR